MSNALPLSRLSRLPRSASPRPCVSPPRTLPLPHSRGVTRPVPAVWALVIARTGGNAKSRLSPVLGVSERAELALAMLVDVLAGCAGVRLSMILAVVDTPIGRAVAEARGAWALLDPGGGMNAAVEAGLRSAASAGAGTVLVLPGDIPLARPDDLRALLAAAGDSERAVIVAPDRAGVGTNALVVRPPGIIRPVFGPASAARHLAAGRLAGAVVGRAKLPTLGLDIDTPADLAALCEQRPGGATGQALSRLLRTGVA
jgi:2-phospho-L-lactate guanylyltransferase